MRSGCRNAAVSAHPIPPRVLADRVERYLRQHPYVSTLVISAVNAGRGDQLADMLVELQRRKQLQHVKYDIRLFAFDGAVAASGRGAGQPDARRVELR